MDSLRGLDDILSPSVLGRSVVRLDLRGHGLSAEVHDSSQGASQYTWSELAKDYRRASHSSLSRAFFGGEAMGAAVALHAAVGATSSGSKDAPPGLVLMRPADALAAAVAGRAPPDNWIDGLNEAASITESEGLEGLEAHEAKTKRYFSDGFGAIYSAENHEADAAALNGLRRNFSADIYAAALRGHASVAQMGGDVKSLGQSRHAMADDAYGVPLTLQCPILILAVPGDSEHSVEAAQELASLLPGTQLEIAESLQDAHRKWANSINAFLRKCWMKEFLGKRVMPQ